MKAGRFLGAGGAVLAASLEAKHELTSVWEHLRECLVGSDFEPSLECFRQIDEATGTGLFVALVIGLGAFVTAFTLGYYVVASWCKRLVHKADETTKADPGQGEKLKHPRMSISRRNQKTIWERLQSALQAFRDGGVL